MFYLVIESDGSIQALDTLRICDKGLPDTGLNVATHGFDDLEWALPWLTNWYTKVFHAAQYAATAASKQRVAADILRIDIPP